MCDMHATASVQAQVYHDSRWKARLNYLCEGYKMFFKYVEPYMDFMAKELKNKRAPANVMNWIRNKENQVRKLLFRKGMIHVHAEAARNSRIAVPRAALFRSGLR